MATQTQIPIVDYLKLGDDPHLVAHECTSCGARFFDRRNACAACFATEFRDVDVPTEGTLRSFTIVTFAAPGVPVPFVAGARTGSSTRWCWAPTTTEQKRSGSVTSRSTPEGGTDEQ